jgi:hypothetical protein
MCRQELLLWTLLIILSFIKHVSETGSISVIRFKKGNILIQLGELERVCLDQWTTIMFQGWTMSKITIMFIVTHHFQKHLDLHSVTNIYVQPTGKN